MTDTDNQPLLKIGLPKGSLESPTIELFGSEVVPAVS